MVWGEGRQTPSTLPPGVAHRNSRSENKLGGGDLGKQRSDAVPTALPREEEAGDRHSTQLQGRRTLQPKRRLFSLMTTRGRQHPAYLTATVPPPLTQPVFLGKEASKEVGPTLTVS